MKDNLVSIIMPCYNAEKYIRESIRSVQAQTYQNWELIVINDGSRDMSAQIVKEIAEKDSRIKLLQQKNAGSAAARNNGIRNAEGRYMALLDSDDLWHSNFLSEQLQFMNEKKALCVSCSYERIDGESNQILHPIIAKSEIKYSDMMKMNYVGCLSGLYDTSVYGKVYLHEELKSIRDDYAYWLDIVKLVGTIYGNPKVLCSYRVLSTSTTGNKWKLIKKQYYFYRNYLKLSKIRSVSNVIQWGISGIKKYK